MASEYRHEVLLFYTLSRHIMNMQNATDNIVLGAIRNGI
jgi:hypothetical protein